MALANVAILTVPVKVSTSSQSIIKYSLCKGLQLVKVCATSNTAILASQVIWGLTGEDEYSQIEAMKKTIYFWKIIARLALDN